MMIDEQNKKGGLLGKKLEAVVVDPASNWPLFAEKARSCSRRTRSRWCSAAGRRCRANRCCRCSRRTTGCSSIRCSTKARRSSKNVIYTGAAPNQQAIPAVDYLMKDVGVKRWVLEGTDYVYPRTTNKILEAYLQAKGVDGRRTSRSTTRRSATPTGRRASPRSRSSARPARRPRWSRPSTATPTCRSTRSSATRNLGGGHPGRRVLGRRRGALRPRRQAAGRPPRGVELLREHQHAGQQGVHRPVARPTSRTRSARPTTRWKRTTSASTCG